MTREKALALRALIEKAAVSLADEDALGGVELFQTWAVGVDYSAGVRVRYDGPPRASAPTLYRCVQTHTSQPGWTPDKTPALWTEVAAPGMIPVWRQPTGEQDAYMTGDRVKYTDENGPVYESLIDNNTWSPEAYPTGWEMI